MVQSNFVLECHIILYSKEGTQFNIHKEVLYQAKLMRSVLLSVDSRLAENDNKDSRKTPIFDLRF